MAEYVQLQSLVPRAEDLLLLEVEEVAGILLLHLQGLATEDKEVQHHNLFNDIKNHPPYPGPLQGAVSRALMESWDWLCTAGLLARIPDTVGSRFFVTRRGQALQTRDQFEDFRKASVLPKDRLHSSIASTVYSAFIRGHYDTAIFDAFREVEIAVRRKAGLPDENGAARLDHIAAD